MTAEKILPVDIYDRDQWRCGICHGPVDPNLAYPDEFSSSVDHILPISLGGAHVATNVRLAHLGCNVDRGNNVMWIYPK